MTNKIGEFYLEVVNWEEFQHYGKRSPPWIKLHRKILDSYNFSCLQDASKLLVILLWLYASQHDNKIPPDPLFLAKILHLEGAIDLDILIKYNFLRETETPFASITLSSCKQSAPSVEERRGEESNGQQGHLVRFDEFWSVWPKRVAKKEAQRAWRSEGCDRIADQIINDVRAKSGNGAWSDRKYIPHPATYLRGRRWEDEDEHPQQQLTPGTEGIT